MFKGFGSGFYKEMVISGHLTLGMISRMVGRSPRMVVTSELGGLSLEEI